MQMYTDRQIALQCATEYCTERNRMSATFDSFDVLRIAERYRKFLEEGIVEEEPKTEPGKWAVTNNGGWKPRIGNG